MIQTDNPSAECPHCGEKFTKLKDGKIPTHDFPKPCRMVCRGSGEQPRRKKSALWKDDPAQQGKDFFDAARQELLVYGFAVVKQMAIFSGESVGRTTCPLCGQSVRFSIAECNGHCTAVCDNRTCITAKE